MSPECKQFFEENMDLSKKLVCCFAGLVFVYFLETTMYECSILVANCALF